MKDQVHDHLIDRDRMERIETRMESYLHLSRRLIVDQFGPEAGGHKDFVLATVSLAGAMAGLEVAEIIASSQDNIAELIDRTGT